MEKPIADVLPYAVAVALSPMPIAALLLMLLSNKARVNSIAFSLGWIIGLAILIFGVAFLVSAAEGTGGGNLQQLMHLVLGVVLILIALKEWHMRTKPGEEPKIPKWMSAVESFTPFKALAIGLAMSTINFKNTPLGIAVGTTLTKYAPENQHIGFIAFLILASSTIVVPTLGFLVAGNKLQPFLQTLKSWLITNNATIMFVLFLILGTVILSKGLAG